MEIIEITESYQPPPTISVTVEQSTEDGRHKKEFQYLIHTGSPKIEFQQVQPLDKNGESAWSAEEVAVIGEMKEMADEEAERRFNDNHVRELFDI